MNVKQQFSRSKPDDISQAVFWGTIALAVLLLILSAYGVLVVFAKNTSTTATIAQVMLALNIGAGIAGLVFTVRRQDRGFALSFLGVLALAIETVLFLEGRAVIATIVLSIVSFVSFFWLCPPQWKRRLLTTTATALVLIWTIEIINPSWRLSSAAAALGLPAGLLFGVIFAIFLFFQTTKSSMRARLIFGFLLVTIVPLVVTGVFNDNSTRTSLTQAANQSLHNAASQTAAQLDSFIENRLNTARAEAQFAAVIDYILLPVSSRPGSIEEIRLNKFIYARLTENPIYITSVAIYDINGVTLADTVTGDIGVPKSDRSWFQNAISTGLPYASNVEFSKATGAPSIYFSAPVRDTAGRIIGVIRTRYDAAILQSIFASQVQLAGQTSYPILVDKQSHMRLAHGTTPSLIYKTIVAPDTATTKSLQERQLLPPGTPEEISTNLPSFESALLAYETQPFFNAELEGTDETTPGNERAAVVKTQHQNWLVVYSVSEDEFLAPINKQALNSIILTVIAGLLVAAFALFIAQSIAGPISRLTQTAETIAGGDINIQAQVETTDEIGTLASTFNRMTQQLRDFINTLESRVAERTRNLELAAEVGRTVSQVRALDVMLTEAAELIREQFDLYYVQVYLVNQSQTYLDLQAGTGYVGKELLGRSHRLPLDSNSINGRAAVDKKSVVIANTTTSPTFKPNPLLPNTRSEMAVPLLIGERAVGVLDMQSQQADSLSKDVLPAFEALAGQLAIAIQNANFLAETEQARAEVEAQAKRLSHTNWNEYLDAIHKPEETGFVFQQNKVLPLTQEAVADEHALVAPLAVTGAAVGDLVVEMGGQSSIAHTEELLSAVARQVSQQIENLRLIDSAERYRFEAEEASRRLTREGWESYATKAEQSLSYKYNLKAVVPQSDGQPMDGYTLPLKVRDESIGKLVVQGLEAEDTESVSLANAIAERLAAHLESLRQFDETQRGQIELDKRARQLASVAEISTTSSREFDVQKMLAAVVHLTQRKFGLYHCHVFLYNEETNLLKIAACGWKEGDEHEGTHGTAAIPLDQEQSLVARAGRTRQPVTVNDVRNEPGWLPNTLLPDTAAELAVPLIIGDRLLGVLDVQADRINAFTEEDANIQTTLASQVATALQNAQSFNQAQSALAQSETLFDASRNLTQATDLQQLVSTAVNTLKIPAINRAILVAFNYGASSSIESLDIIANWWNGTGHEATTIGTHYPLEVIRAMPLFISSTPVFFNDAFNDERVDATTMHLVQRLNLRAVAVLPLHTTSGQIGALILEAEVPHTFTTDETRLFIAIAPQIATIVDNRRQYEETQRAQTQSEKLFEASRNLTQARDLQGLVQVSVEAFNVPEIDRAILGVLDYNAQGEVVGMSIAANWSGDPSLPATPVGTHYPKEALRALSLFMGPQPLFFTDMLNDERVDEKMRDIPKRLNYRSVAALPLFAGSRQDALLLLEGKEPHNFVPDEIRLFTAMAPQIGTVLENRRQFEQAQKQAEREAMLNVINQKIQSATSVEAVLQIAARELGHALGAPMTIAQLSMKDRSS